MTADVEVPTRAERRALFLFPVVLACLSMLGPFTIDTPFPAFEQMARDFAVDSVELQLVVSAYLLAFAVMSPFHGPISDAVGRRPVMVAGVLVFALASVGCALSPDLPTLLVFRVLQGLSAGGGVIVSRTVVRDLYDGDEAQQLMSRIMMIFGVAPAVAPIVGGLLLQVGPWELIFWFLAGLGVLLAGFVVVALPESHPPERRIAFRPASLVASLAGPCPPPAVPPGRLGGGVRLRRAVPLHRRRADLRGRPAGAGRARLLGVLRPDDRRPHHGCVHQRTRGRPRLARTARDWAIVGALAGAGVNVLLAAIPATSAELPWAVVGPALIAVGTGTAYPSQQLILMDLFPESRGAAVSLFTFFTLVLNAVIASTLAPVVTDTVLHMAIASMALVAVGLVSWRFAVTGGTGALPPVTAEAGGASAVGEDVAPPAG